MIPQRKKRIREGIRLKTVEIGLVFNTLTFWGWFHRKLSCSLIERSQMPQNVSSVPGWSLISPMGHFLFSLVKFYKQLNSLLYCHNSDSCLLICQINVLWAWFRQELRITSSSPGPEGCISHMARAATGCCVDTLCMPSTGLGGNDTQMSQTRRNAGVNKMAT